jgi:hypothetical protein
VITAGREGVPARDATRTARVDILNSLDAPSTRVGTVDSAMHTSGGPHPIRGLHWIMELIVANASRMLTYGCIDSSGNYSDGVQEG